MTAIVPLNLPKTNLILSRSGNNIHVNCLVRKKKIILTPEEWVRQHFIAYFIDKLEYPRGLLTIEKKIQYGGIEKRWDLAVFMQDQSCFLLLECKAPSIPINQIVFEQSLAYYKELQAKYLVMSNGNDHVILKKEINGFKRLTDFPAYNAPIA